MLSHVLSHDACLKKLNEKLELIGVHVKRAERNFCAISVHGETNTLVQENKEQMYKIIKTFCQEHIVMHDCDVDENRFSLADVKFGKFLEGLDGKVSVFYLDGKMVMIGHEIDINNFQENILSSVLNDPVVTESIKLEEEQFVYLKVLKNKFIKKFNWFYFGGGKWLFLCQITWPQGRRCEHNERIRKTFRGVSRASLDQTNE